MKNMLSSQFTPNMFLNMTMVAYPNVLNTNNSLIDFEIFGDIPEPHPNNVSRPWSKIGRAHV